MIALDLVLPPTPVEIVAEAANFQGELLLARDGDVVLQRGFGSRKPGGTAPFTGYGRWRFASVSKQLTATLVMQQVTLGKLDLDAPLTRYLPAFKGPTGASITVRQLLRHESGLPDPNDDVTAYTPAFRGSYDALDGICAGPVRDQPGASFRYNNCDYMLAGRLLEAVTGEPFARLVATRIAAPVGATGIALAPAGALPLGGFDGGKAETTINLPAFGAAGALTGTARDLWRFDEALMGGRLLSAAALATMWDGQPKLGYAALGQWVFTVPLKGCAGPVKIVERRGAIGGVQVRNLILPDKHIVLIAFTNRGETDFGEIWQGKGLSHDLLAAAACPA